MIHTLLPFNLRHRRTRLIVDDDLRFRRGFHRKQEIRSFSNECSSLLNCVGSRSRQQCLAETTALCGSCFAICRSCEGVTFSAAPAASASASRNEDYSFHRLKN